MADLAALARFHLHVGTRLALRAAAPLVALPILAVLLQQDPGGAVKAAGAWLLGPWSGPGAGLALGLAALTLAGWAAPRVTAGLAGWPRHLPVSQGTHRRAALVALATAQAPVLAGVLVLAPFAARGPAGIAPARLLALPVMAAAAAVAAWPGCRSWRSRPLALLALLLLAEPSTAHLLVAPFLVAAADRLAGPLRSGDASGRRRRSRALPTPLLIAARALGPSAAVTVAVALLPIGAMTLLRVNNDLAPPVAAGAARFGGGLAVAFLLGGLVERLAARRPVWPWSRSLPVASTWRVAEDALLLGVCGLVPIVVTACLDPVAALTVAACLPLLAFRAAGALRAGTRPHAGAGGLLLGEAALLAGWVAVLPWLAGPALLAAPLAWRAAAERDRRQKVSHWDELHHRVVGDPLSWSAR